MKQKTFDSLSTLPIWNFFKVKNGGNLIYLLDIENHSETHISKEQIEYLYQKWEELDTEFIDRFAMNQEFINRCLIEKTILLLKLDEITSTDPFIKNRIKAEEMKLEEETVSSGKFDIDKTVGFVEKFMSFQIDIFKTPIAKLYAYINQMQDKALKSA
jgi:hypothetical protein